LETRAIRVIETNIDLSRLWDAVALWVALWHWRRSVQRDYDYVTGSLDDWIAT
jgi:hypothetical protein